MAVIAEQIPRTRRALTDNLNRLAFHLAWIKKLQLRRRRRELDSVEDYFRFSRKVFKLVQIEQEIGGFIELLRKAAPKVICEIGTRSCGTSFMLSQAVPTVEFFLGLDLYVSNWSQFRTFARAGQEITALAGSSYDDVTVQCVTDVLQGRQLDVLFIDGDHSYEGSKKDFELYRHFVRDGGLIAFHDIVPDRRSHLGTTTGPYSGGVPQIWNKVKAAYPHHEFIAKPDQDGFGIGAIEYSASAAAPEL